MADHEADVTDLGPFGAHFTTAWPEIAQCFTRHWGRDVVKARLVTGWSVLFRVKRDDTWRLKTWCDSEQSHLWGCNDARIVAEMRLALSLGTVTSALGKLKRPPASEESPALGQPLRWVRDSLQELNEGH